MLDLQWLCEYKIEERVHCDALQKYNLMHLHMSRVTDLLPFSNPWHQSPFKTWIQEGA